MPAVSLRGVIKEFSDGTVRAVDEVSFDVEDGELLVLLGPSGCGKTTSLRMIAGLEEPDGGEITIGGKVMSSAERNLFVPTEKRNIGMVFQSYAIWPHMTVFENVAYPLRVRRTPRSVIRQKVEKTLALTGLAGLEQRPATHLSGGQQQRVALARALVFEPRLLLLDEPLSNLDAKLRIHMRSELKQLQRQTGITSVFVTHDQAESMALADRVIVMNAGRIEQVGPPQEIYERPRTQFVSDFVGTSNLLPAQAVEKPAGGEFVRLTLEGSDQEIRAALLPEVAAELGRLALVSMRPEKLALQREPTTNGARNVWRGQVKATTYYGDHREYEVEVDGHSLKVHTPVSVALQPGETAYVACDPADVVLWPRGH